MPLTFNLSQKINDIIALQNTTAAEEKMPRSLYEPIEYILQMGGKRIRPTLCLLAGELFGNPTPNLKDGTSLALALEYFHNFSLVHDDVMDAAPLRRGQPTMHHKYGLNTAILSGDMMLIEAYQYLGKVTPKYLPACLGLFNETTAKVCEGQQYDMDFEEKDDILLADYVQMIEGKTAILLAASLQMGAIVNDASAADQKAIYEFGRHIGIAFQLLDDILDVYGDTVKVGKQKAGDILQNKKTALSVMAFEKAEGEVLEALKYWFNPASEVLDNQAKITAVMAIYEKLKVKDLASQKMAVYHQKAFDFLGQIKVDDSRKKPLVDYVEALSQRIY